MLLCVALWAIAVAVIIYGPAGSGKEVAARLVHQWSSRTDAPFVVVSAARMTPERVEAQR